MASETLLQEETIEDNKYMGYKIDDLSDSLGAALGKDNKIKPSTPIAYIHYFESINWINLIPSLHTTLVIMYFSLLVCILGGISSYMWKKFDIKTKSQSKQAALENQLLGSGKYAQYVNAAVAFKIYQEEMAKMESDSDSDHSSNDSNNSSDDSENNTINESTLIGGYQKTKKLRARTIRKQKLREQRENYQRYKKRLEYEKQLKRYNKIKEKKHAKKIAKKVKQEKKSNKLNNNGGNGWFKSMYTSVMGAVQNDNTNQNESNEKLMNNNKSKLNIKRNKIVSNSKNEYNKSDKMKKYKKSLEQMIMNDCCNEIIIDLDKYYANKIKTSDVYCKIITDIKSLKKMVKSLCSEYKECEGMIDSNSNVYFRWNEQCEQKLVSYIQNTGKCDVKTTGNKMLAISKEMFQKNQ